MMQCRDLQELLSAYADGELHQTQREFIETHLRECRECRDTLAAFISTKHDLRRLRDMTACDDITGQTMARLREEQEPQPRRVLAWVRPLALGLAALAAVAVLVILQPWDPATPEARAAAIVRNSPELRAALNGEEIKEVEVTTKLVDGEGNVWLTLVRTEERAVAAEVDIETEQVTEIIRVDVPGFQPDDEQKALDIIEADSRIRELLAQGGSIREVHPVYSLGIELVTGPDGTPQKVGTVTPVVFVSIQLDGKDWNVTVDPREGTILSIGQAQPSTGMLVKDWSRTIYGVLNPFMIVIGMLLAAGWIFRKKLAEAVTGIYAAVAGVVAVYGGIYAWPTGCGDQVLALAVPVLGLIIGVMGIRRRRTRRWVPVTGVVLCSLALVWVVFDRIMLLVV